MMPDSGNYNYSTMFAARSIDFFHLFQLQVLSSLIFFHFNTITHLNLIKSSTEVKVLHCYIVCRIVCNEHCLTRGWTQTLISVANHGQSNQSAKFVEQQLKINKRMNRRENLQTNKRTNAPLTVHVKNK